MDKSYLTSLNNILHYIVVKLVTNIFKRLRKPYYMWVPHILRAPLHSLLLSHKKVFTDHFQNLVTLLLDLK